MYDIITIKSARIYIIMSDIITFIEYKSSVLSGIWHKMIKFWA